MNINDTRFLNPVDPFVLPSATYELIAISKATRLIENGIDIYETVYKPANFSAAEYINVLKTQPVIYTLKRDGNIYYIPQDGVLANDETYVDYVRQAIVVDLGALPVGENLTLIEDSIREVIKQHLNIDTNTTTHNVSEIQSISQSNADELAVNRTVEVSEASSSSDTIQLLQIKVNALVEFIKVYLQRCCDEDICFITDEDAPFFGQYRRSLSYYVAYRESLDGVTSDRPIENVWDAWNKSILK